MSSASPLLVRLSGSPEAVIRLNRPLTLVGSKAQSHLRIVAAEISGAHAVLVNLGNNVFLRDLMSRTHLYVNDRQTSECRLKFGDVVQFGEMRFRFADSDVVRRSLTKLTPADAELQGVRLAEPARLRGPAFVIGRQPGADLMLQDDRVSKAHAVIFPHEGHWVLRDLGSRHGTFANGNPVRTTILHGGELLQIGRTTLRFVVPGQEASADAITDAAADAEMAEAERAGESHVFVAEPVVVSDPGTLQSSPVDDLAPATASDEPSGQPNWYLETGHSEAGEAIEAASDEPIADEEPPDTAADLVDWGLVATPAALGPIEPSPGPPLLPAAEKPDEELAFEPLPSDASVEAQRSRDASDPRDPSTAPSPPRPAETQDVTGLEAGPVDIEPPAQSGEPGPLSEPVDLALKAVSQAPPREETLGAIYEMPVADLERNPTATTDPRTSEIASPPLAAAARVNTGGPAPEATQSIDAPLPGIDSSKPPASPAPLASPAPQQRAAAEAGTSRAVSQADDSLGELVTGEILPLFAPAGSRDSQDAYQTADAHRRGGWRWVAAAGAVLLLAAVLAGAGWYYLHRYR